MKHLTIIIDGKTVLRVDGGSVETALRDRDELVAALLLDATSWWAYRHGGACNERTAPLGYCHGQFATCPMPYPPYLTRARAALEGGSDANR